MSVVDIFIAIFLGTWLFDYVVKVLVKLYLDVREKLNKK